ncbi:hypothetical protein B0H13DRAFT_1649670, partial [Mycena leptocephala]
KAQSTLSSSPMLIQPRYPSSLPRFLCLCSWMRNAGLTEAQFRNLFVRCSHCKLYTTTSAFEDHSCRTPSTASIEIIDLTADE